MILAAVGPKPGPEFTAGSQVACIKRLKKNEGLSRPVRWRIQVAWSGRAAQDVRSGMPTFCAGAVKPLKPDCRRGCDFTLPGWEACGFRGFTLPGWEGRAKRGEGRSAVRECSGGDRPLLSKVTP